MDESSRGCVGRSPVMTAVLPVVLLLLSLIPGAVSAEETKPAGDPLVGCLLPLSGRHAGYGQQALDAVLLAAGVFDAAGGSKIRILIQDSRSEPAVAGEAVEKLAAAGAACILGPLGSQEALEAASRAQRLHIPILTLTQKEEITATGDYVFRNFLTAALQVRRLVHYARTELGHRRFAVLYPDDAYGREMARLFREEVPRRGGEIRREASYQPDQTDFGEEISALGGAAPAGPGEAPAGEAPPVPKTDFEALFIPDGGDRVVMIVPQLAYHDLARVRLLGTSGWDSPGLLKGDPKLLEGAVFVDAFFRDSYRSEVNDFIERFYAAYGREPDTMDALVYDAAAMAVRLLADQRGATREEFRDRLARSAPFPGVTGKTFFPPSRDAEKELFVLTVRDGRIVQVK